MSHTIPKIPVTVLSGFLGSGKTTLVNHILTAEHGHRVAVIENEFGDIPIDNALVIGGDEQILEMSNGCCLCCTARTDLIDILTSLIDRKDSIDRVLIETSGMADPNPVAQTFFVDETIAEHYSLDAIVTLVDAKHIEAHLDETNTDGVGNQATHQIAFGDRIVINKVDLVDSEQLASVRGRIRSINASAEILASSYGEVNLEQILGISAFNRYGLDGSTVEWLHNEDHHHEPTLDSVSIEVAGELDMDAVQSWFTEHVEAHGHDLYRLKGVLQVAGEQVPYLIQGVHKLFTIAPRPISGTAPTGSVVVFIGRNLDRDALTEGLQSCLAEPALVG